jgi:hypothetical protein
MNRRYPLDAEFTYLMTKAQEERLHERLAAEFPDVASDARETIAGFTDRFLDEQGHPARSLGGKKKAELAKAVAGNRRKELLRLFNWLPAALKAAPSSAKTLGTLHANMKAIMGPKAPSQSTLKRDLRALDIKPERRSKKDHVLST